MGSGAKCNQTGCNNPAAFRYTWPGEAENSICHEHSSKLQEIAKAIGCPIQLIPLKEPADQPDIETLKALKLKEHGRGDSLPGAEGSEQNDPVARELLREIYPMMPKNFCMYHGIVVIISRYLQKAGAEASEHLNRECDALKASNSELRDQLCANTKLISELQHTVRLVQETHSQQVHEYAKKAAIELFNASILAKPEAPTSMVQTLLLTEQIICEVFSMHLKSKDEIQEEFERHWANLPKWINQEQKETCFEAFKLAKGDK